MKINNYELNYSEEKLDEMLNGKIRFVDLVGKDFEGYQALPDGDKKALEHLVAAGKIMNDVAMEFDHPLNLTMKKALEAAAPSSSHVTKALRLFTSMAGVEGNNGIDAEQVRVFKGIEGYKGRNFYPADLSVDEFHTIIKNMVEAGKISEVKKILNARSMVRRQGTELVAIDYTKYFAKEFSIIANELEVAAHYATNPLFKEYLGWQVQALLQDNEDMDMLADKHWANMQDTELEFTISRENYDDEMTSTICENPELLALLESHGIDVVNKDMLGIRVGIINKKGTELLLTFKEHMKKLAQLMPYSDRYNQSVSQGDEIKQTMVDADLVALCGDFAQCRGAITTAENLPNNDKLSIKTGGGRRNVYHRQVRMSFDAERNKKLLDALVNHEFHQYFNPEAEHIYVIGHENGHSLGPDAEYQSALGYYRNVIEENKADIVSIAFMPEYVKAGIINDQTLKEIYTTWIVRVFLKARPTMAGIPHRIGDLIHFNYLLEHGVISFAQDNKLSIDFSKMHEVVSKLLEETIEVQLSKSPVRAKEFMDRHTTWGELHEYIAGVQKQLGLKPYIEIRTHF